jgi:hypothetical protein
LEHEYQKSEDHLELVAATASAFHQTELAGGYESGYEFAFTEPLEEQNSEVVGEEGVTNGDVLLVKEDGPDVYICIVECKAGTHAGREWAKELSDIEDAVDEYRDTLKRQIGVEQKEIRHEQYVLLGRISQIVAMNEDNFDISENYAFWGYETGERELVHIQGEVRDLDLKRIITDSIDTSLVENPIEFTYSDHPLTQLKVLIENMIREKHRRGDEHPFEFEKETFRERFNDELQVGFAGEVREQLVGQRVESLLELGTAMEIFEDDSDCLQSERDYRVLFRGKKATYAKEVTDKKYFEWAPEQKRKEQAFEEVRDEFNPSQTRFGEEWPSEEDEDEEEEDEQC